MISELLAYDFMQRAILAVIALSLIHIQVAYMGKQNELKKIGEIYRELRLDKGTKLSNYIDKGFSKSQLSRRCV